MQTDLNNKVIVYMLGTDPYDHTRMDVIVKALTQPLEVTMENIKSSILDQKCDSNFAFYRAVLLDVVTGESQMLIQENKPQLQRIEVNLPAKARILVKKVQPKVSFDENFNEVDDEDGDDPD